MIKTGAAFVLLDLSYPDRRIKEIYESVGAKITLYLVNPTAKSAPLVPKVVPIDENEYTWSQAQTGQLDSTVHPRNALYTIFTSGSTGKPKEIVLKHEAFTTTAQSYLRTTGLNA